MKSKFSSFIRDSGEAEKREVYEKVMDAVNKEQADLVNNPPHYTQGGIECIEAIEAALTQEEFRGFCKGNALKYVWRERHKGQNESLDKAMWYLDRIDHGSEEHV